MVRLLRTSGLTVQGSSTACIAIGPFLVAISLDSRHSPLLRAGLGVWLPSASGFPCWEATTLSDGGHDKLSAHRGVN